jgi:hypothetical protein
MKGVRLMARKTRTNCVPLINGTAALKIVRVTSLSCLDCQYCICDDEYPSVKVCNRTSKVILAECEDIEDTDICGLYNEKSISAMASEDAGVLPF